MKTDLVQPSIFNIAAVPLEKITDPVDTVFLGIPIDVGSLRRPGARLGPDGVREFTSKFFQGETRHIAGTDCGSLALKGCYDADYEVSMLAGVSALDVGNLAFQHDEPLRVVYDRLTSSIKRIVDLGALPILLGGDHSISYPILRGLNNAPCAVIQFDAHEDLGRWDPSREHDYANAFRRISGLAHVKAIYQLGVRGISSGATDTTGLKIEAYSSSRIRSEGPREIVSRLDPAMRYYVSIDIDVLDPSVAPGVSTPIMGGLWFHELKELLWQIGTQRSVVGFDLVELNPQYDHANLTAHIAGELVLSFWGAIFRGRQTHSCSWQDQPPAIEKTVDP